MAVRIRVKMAERKKLACPLLGLSHSLPSIARWQTRRGKTACQGRQPPKAGAEGPPLQGVLPRHTRPPSSTADPCVPPSLLGFTQPLTMRDRTEAQRNLLDASERLSSLHRAIGIRADAHEQQSRIAVDGAMIRPRDAPSSTGGAFTTMPTAGAVTTSRGSYDRS